MHKNNTQFNTCEIENLKRVRVGMIMKYYLPIQFI